MTKRSSVLRRVLALIFTLAVFFTASGFTFSPSVAPDFYAYVEFGVDGSGNLTSTTENLTLPKPEYYSAPHTFKGKTGVTSKTGSGDDKNLYLMVDTAKFGNIHDVKITVEYYDAVGQREDNCIRVKYPSTANSKTTGSEQVNTSGGTEQWVTKEVILTDIYLTNNTWSNNNNSANLYINAPKSTATTHGTEDTSDDYPCVLIHSVKIEPLGAYRLEQCGVNPVVAHWKADGTVSENITMLSNPTATRTITSIDGVTMTGKAWGKVNGNNKVLFVLDADKFSNVSAVNVTVTYFDGKDSNNPNTMTPLKAMCLNQSGSLMNAGQTYAKGITQKWQAYTATMTNCSFAPPAMDYGSNLQLYVGNAKMDNCTPDDTSDDFCGTLISEITVEEIPEWTFSGLKFTDAAGAELKALNAGGDFHTELTVNRTGGSGTASVTLIAALMDQSNRVERIDTQTLTFEPNTSKAMQVCFHNPADVKGKKVRIMIWDSLTGLMPISNMLACS